MVRRKWIAPTPMAHGRWRPHVSGTSLSVQKFRFRLVKIGACPFSKNRAGHLQPTTKKKINGKFRIFPYIGLNIGLIYGTSNQSVPGQHGHWKICSSQPSPVPKRLLTRSLGATDLPPSQHLALRRGMTERKAPGEPHLIIFLRECPKHHGFVRN
jgi:hypothetical protein